jgi:hypothetical protein
LRQLSATRPPQAARCRQVASRQWPPGQDLAAATGCGDNCRLNANAAPLFRELALFRELTL